MELGEPLLGPLGHLCIGRHHLQQDQVGWQPFAAAHDFVCHLSRVKTQQHGVKDVRVHLNHRHQSFQRPI